MRRQIQSYKGAAFARVGDVAKQDAISAVWPLALRRYVVCLSLMWLWAIALCRWTIKRRKKRRILKWPKRILHPTAIGLVLCLSIHTPWSQLPSYHDIATTAALGTISVLIAPSEGAGMVMNSSILGRQAFMP